jgi:hypothetical protein
MRGITFVVEEGQAEYRDKQHDARFADELRAALSKAGFKIAASRLEPYDYVLEVSVAAHSDWTDGATMLPPYRRIEGAYRNYYLARFSSPKITTGLRKNDSGGAPSKIDYATHSRIQTECNDGDVGHYSEASYHLAMPEWDPVRVAAFIANNLATCDALHAYALALKNGVPASAAGVSVATKTPSPAAAPAAAPAVPVVLAPTPSDFVVASPQPAAHAVLIGVERYRSAPNVTGARTDVARMRQLVKRTLGITDDRILEAVDDHATKGDIEAALIWARNKAKAGGRLYFYFSGHGVPEVKSGAASSMPHLLPYDGSPENLQTTAIPLARVTKELGESQAREVVVMLDTCFSGSGGRSVLPAGTRALVRTLAVTPPASKMLVLSAAGPTEISGPSPGEAVGLFTKTLTDGLGKGSADQNGDGQVTATELQRYLSDRVPREAARDKRSQNPQMSVGRALGSADALPISWGYAGR